MSQAQETIRLGPTSTPADSARLTRAFSELPPQRIGRYEILAELGKGGMGIVYQARDPQLGRIVALKTLRRDLGFTPDRYVDLKKRFYQEATAAGRLNHDGIAAIHDVVELDGIPYIVMEYLEGRTLAEILSTDGRLAPADAVRLAVQVCQALAFAHSQGVVHRDIKPANIVLTNTRQAKVTDFGIARVAGSDVTQTGVMLGTPAYMSPEQLQGGVDARSDLFSLGVVLYEALTGINPFHSEDLAAILYQVVHVDPPPARTRNSGVSPALDGVIRRALAKRPEQRYPDARAFAEALRQTLTPSGRFLLQSGLGKRGRRALIGAVVLILLSAGGWAVWERWTRDMARESQEWDAGTARAPASATPQPPTNRSSEPRSVASPTLPTRVPETERPAAALGSIRVTTTPAAEVFVDGAYKGRAGEEPMVVPDLAVGEHRVTLRLGGREHVLRGKVREGRVLVLSYLFPADPPAPPPAARVEAASPPPAAPRTVPAGAVGCLSVNAIPFASVYVDGQYAGDTPRACLRIPLGERRVRFEAAGERSPERVVQLTAQHTAADPLRLSYDFKSHRFIQP